VAPIECVWIFHGEQPGHRVFYLLTGVHGLHLLGGLFVWGKTVVRMAQAGVELLDVALSVELCTVYCITCSWCGWSLFALLLSTLNLRVKFVWQKMP